MGVPRTGYVSTDEQRKLRLLRKIEEQTYNDFLDCYAYLGATFAAECASRDLADWARRAKPDLWERL